MPFKEEDPLISLLADIVTNISHILIVTNSAINIVVYTLKVKVLIENSIIGKPFRISSSDRFCCLFSVVDSLTSYQVDITNVLKNTVPPRHA